MNGYDGQLEAQAILDRLSGLAGGRVYEYQPDDSDLELDSSGKIRPFIIVHFGETIADTTDRTMVGDASQPYILPVTVQYAASNPQDIRSLSAAAKELFMEWQPSPTSYMPAPIGTQTFPLADTSNRPTRYNRLAHYPVTVNLGT